MLLRRTCALRFRATPLRRSGGDLYHPPKLEDVPPASTAKTLFGPLTQRIPLLRLIDLRWLADRAVQTGHEHYIVLPIFGTFSWMFAWKGFVIARYGDGAPPRKVDWNTEEAGYLPHGFTPTAVPRRL